MDRLNSLISKDGWILCAKCGHKLARVYKKLSIVRETGLREDITGIKIEFKCTSCKTINVWEVKND